MILGTNKIIKFSKTMFDRIKILFHLLLLRITPYERSEDITERRITREEVENRRRKVLLSRLAGLEQER